MNIVIDTNVIVPEYGIDGSRTRTLLHSVPSTPHSLYVPEIVVDEVAATAMKKLLRVREAVQAASRKDDLRRLPDDLAALIRVPQDDEMIARVDGYRDRLMGSLRSAGAHIIDYPSLGHKRVMQRMMRGQRPFLYDNDDEGYRDVLVWESVLKLAHDSPEPIVFVSLDKAFGENGRLHQHLVNDLVYNGFGEDRVVLYMDWDAFVEDYLSVSKVLEEARTKLLNSDFEGESLHDVVTRVASEQLSNYTLPQGTVGISAHVVSAVVTAVTEVGVPELGNVVKLASGEVLARVRARVTVMLDMLINVSGSWPPGEPRPIGGQDQFGPMQAEIWLTLSVTTNENIDKVIAADVVTLTSTGMSPLPVRSEADVRDSHERAEESKRRHGDLLNTAREVVTEFGARCGVERFGGFSGGQVLIARWDFYRLAIIAVYITQDFGYHSILPSARAALGSYVRTGGFDRGVIVTSWSVPDTTHVGSVAEVNIAELRNFLQRELPRPISM